MVDIEGIIQVDSLGRLGRGLVETAKIQYLPHSSLLWLGSCLFGAGSSNMSYFRAELWAMAQSRAFLSGVIPQFLAQFL